MPRRNVSSSSSRSGNSISSPRRPAKAVPSQIAAFLGSTEEQQAVVGPLVAYLTMKKDWKLGQLVFGTREWRVPKRPSEATKRERRHDYDGFPVDVAIFDSIKRVSDPLHLLAIIECKTPDESVGVSQLESYLAMEPHARVGIWLNSPDPTSAAVFVYRMPDGTLMRKRRTVADIPASGDPITPSQRKLTFADLAVPSAESMRRVFQELLDRVVVDDPNVTRREEQLDQLCNVLLLKLQSDKNAKLKPNEEPFFRPRASPSRTAEELRAKFRELTRVYPDTFSAERDKQLLLSDTSLAQCVERLTPFKLIDVGVTTVSLGFQVLRAAALKSGEGQYFTPQPVIAAGIKLLNITLDDLVIDPACGTGGFLVEILTQLQRGHQGQGQSAELSKWAQTHLYGIDKDAIAVKLTKAIMQIADDGSAHCVRGDSVRTHLWPTSYPHLATPQFENDRFSVVVTNPPFGRGLKVSANDARLAGLDIAAAATGNYVDLEIGLLFLQRAYELLRVGGRLGIVLPETYFFSPQYLWLFDWLEPRLRPIAIADIPMEAFAGFCRAKTNFYVFEKIG